MNNLQIREVNRVATEVLDDGSVLIIEWLPNFKIRFNNFWRYRERTRRVGVIVNDNISEISENEIYRKAVAAINNYKSEQQLQ